MTKKQFVTGALVKWLWVGRGFESQHCILDGHFHIYFVKINEKEAEDGPFKKQCTTDHSINWGKNLM